MTYESNNITCSVSEQAASLDLREAFSEWLSAGNGKKVTPHTALTCLDRISEYVVSKRISCSVWKISKIGVFKSVYQKVMGAKLLRIMERNTLKTFEVVGKLYARFLKEKPWEVKDVPKVIFTKEVDWSLFNYGFAVPQSVVDDFCSNVEQEVPKSGSVKIKLAIDKDVFSAILSNIPSRNGRTQLQVRYSSTSGAAKALRKIFGASYTYLKGERDGDSNAVPPVGSQSAEIVGLGFNLFGVICNSAGEDSREGDSEPIVESADTAVNQTLPDIRIDEVVAWLVTQPNARGTLYLGNVVWSYMSMLRDAPQKLKLAESVNRNVFACHTVQELDRLWESFKAAPNYTEVNQHGRLSAGLAVYCRYLGHIGNDNNNYIITKNEAVAEKTTESPTQIDLSDDYREAIKLVLEERYTNGFRLDSIELVRLRRFVKKAAEIELTLSDSELTEAVKSCGLFIDNKVYSVKKEAQQRIERLITNYFKGGAKVVFYERFYSKNISWLSEASIASERILKNVLRQIFPNLIFTAAYFGHTSVNINSVLVSEIIRVWGDDTILNYEQISQRLEYITIERIKFALGQNPDFVWNNIEHFVHISKIVTNDGEWEMIRETAERECINHRYVSVTDLTIESFAERNHELSLTAVQTAVFQLYLSNDYDRRGKIITPKGEKLDALEIMREYCRSLKRVTLEELLNFECELTGENHRWIPMQAGYDVMVRINKDIYLAEQYVDFDVQGIDGALEHFVHGEYTPLRTVTTFAVFPHCGQAWNLFLLESYVRRFSKLFRFECPSVNNKNAGCIVRKNSKLDYFGIMADAVAKSDIQLNETSVVDFLYNNGYRGSRQKAKISDLIKQAKKLRDRRD